MKATIAAILLLAVTPFALEQGGAAASGDDSGAAGNRDGSDDGVTSDECYEDAAGGVQRVTVSAHATMPPLGTVKYTDQQTGKSKSNTATLAPGSATSPPKAMESGTTNVAGAQMSIKGGKMKTRPKGNDPDPEWTNADKVDCDTSKPIDVGPISDDGGHPGDSGGDDPGGDDSGSSGAWASPPGSGEPSAPGGITHPAHGGSHGGYPQTGAGEVPTTLPDDVDPIGSKPDTRTLREPTPLAMQGGGHTDLPPRRYVIAHDHRWDSGLAPAAGRSWTVDRPVQVLTASSWRIGAPTTCKGSISY